MIDLKSKMIKHRTRIIATCFEHLKPQSNVNISQDARSPMQHWANSGYKLDLILAVSALFLGGFMASQPTPPPNVPNG